MKSEGKCTNCAALKERLDITLCNRCSEKAIIKSHKNVEKLKSETFKHYGNNECACCKEREELFLGLDHINNDGNKDTYSGKGLYYKLKRLGWPEGFRVLCHNCNLGRYLNGGECPHVKNSQ